MHQIDTLELRDFQQAKKKPTLKMARDVNWDNKGVSVVLVQPSNTTDKPSLVSLSLPDNALGQWSFE